MSVTIKRNDIVGAEELNELLATNHWSVNPIEKLEKCIKTSWGNVCARNGLGELIGYIRMISDGIRHAYLCSLIVHPDYRRRGIGEKILNEAIKLLKEENLYPTLVAGPGKRGYYEKFGFQVENNGFTAMCIRKWEN